VKRTFKVRKFRIRSIMKCRMAERTPLQKAAQTMRPFLFVSESVGCGWKNNTGEPMKNERGCSAPGLLLERFHLILLVMSSLHYDFACGAEIGVNCHAVARALGRIFPDFAVIDGYVPRLASVKHDEAYGEEVLFRLKPGLKAFMGRIDTLPHSWLAWKQDGSYIIDIWPIGGVPGASPPVLIHQDRFAMCYEPGSLPPGVVEENLAADVLKFSERFTKRLEELLFMTDGFRTASKTPA
jgi:hypothetical protein